MIKISVLETIKERLSIFTNLYDTIRVIDPEKKQVIATSATDDEGLNSTCYCYWKKHNVCTNCVSIKAIKENNTFMKIETKDNKVFLTTASPVVLDDKTYIVELLKDITHEHIAIKPENTPAESIDSLLLSITDELVTDSLTKVYNRRFIDSTLSLDIGEGLINKKPLSIILSDIDNFKEINDTYGHIAGDFILKEFSKLISDSIRKTTDWIARYGGEEFLIVLRNTKGVEAFAVAEKLRKLVEKNEFVFEGNVIHITASFGICYLEKFDNIEPSTFINCADKNLYAAKEDGRNKVVMDFYKEI
ncbi:diguanylate cyclase (GGDEF)-like protein [Clostridium punense]|uniref:Diguanylate cyclase (GGDEF)-like protein n=1 Tax=Clostridium punense TaxID=1054297 RepID=A0ABS4K2S4_9CLOT|nr:GGDEF domain-containing protein [Clostridium sp. BL8]EQB86975.1 hypothetical protein M918_11565 [Clostridium sp. BL8]MBP2022091.1 diguanylate cyclase (GGDEF)-like protein [Clostridium punense]